MSANGKLTIGALLWIQAIFLGSTFGTWIVVIAVCSLATMVVIADHQKASSKFVQRLSPRRTWSVKIRLLLIIAAMLVIFSVSLLWRFASQSGPDVNLLSVGVDTVAHWSFFLSLFLWSLSPSRGHFLMLGLGLTLLLSGVAAGGTSRSMAAQTSIALAACVGFAAASQILLSTIRGGGGNLEESQQTNDERMQWMARTVSLTTISLILMTTGVIANATSRILPGLQLVVQEQLHDSLDVIVDRTGFGGTRYVKSGKLGSVRDHIVSDPKAIALVVESKYAPGYLRGRVYDVYQQRRWFTSARLDQALTGAQPASGRVIRPSAVGSIDVLPPRSRKLNRFVLSSANDKGSETATFAHLTVYNNPVKGYVIFAPLATMWIEARGDELMIHEHGELGIGIDVTKPYVVGVGERPTGESLTLERRKVLTDVPDSIQRQAERIAATVCPRAGTTQSKAVAVSRYFQSGGVYSLQPPAPPPQVDPIAYFLQQRHPAHCEYFASATVAVLRSAGIPARYVTGYVVNEMDENSANMWLARNQNAHAWVEAYDEQTRRWFPVESTPGRSYQTLTPSAVTRAGAGATDSLGDSVGNGSNTLIGKFWAMIVSIRTTDALVVIFQISQLPLFISLVTFWWVKFRRRPWASGDATDSISLKMLRKADRKVRKHSLWRRPSETLFQFADRIESTLGGTVAAKQRAERERLANWYRDYASARYRGRVPKPFGQMSN